MKPREECFLDFYAAATLGTWRGNIFPGETPRSTMTGTYMEVTVINTVLSTTSVKTSVINLPPEYTPPPTNSAGTRIGVFVLGSATKTV
jgi:hypothetical protein